MSLKIFFVRVHKWTALVVGIQLFLWVAGGLVMSLSDIDEVHGERTKARIEPKPLRGDRLVALEKIFDQAPEPIAALQLSDGMLGPEYRLTGISGAVHRFDAQSGTRLDAIDADQALAIATAHYSGAGVGQTPIQVSRNSTEYRGRLPVWRVDFDDDAETSLYVAADTGEVVTRRNRLWRVYDVAWMLHIMDYREREDFNHPLLVSASVLALLVALSGIYLIIVASWRNDIRAFLRRK